MASKTTLWLIFDATIEDRDDFLQSIRTPVIEFTHERMRLDALIHEIAKNIFDHAGKRGSLLINKKGSMFEFCIRDEGTEPFDIETVKASWSPVHPGVNFGIGLSIIKDLAVALNIDLMVDTSKGFCYSGSYTPENTT